MRVEELNKRSQTKGGSQRPQTYNASGQITDQGSQSVNQHPAPEVGELAGALMQNQSEAVIGRDAYIGLLQ